MWKNFFALAVFVCTFAITGCIHRSQNVITAIRIGTGSRAIDYAPYYVAKSNGWFDDLGKRHGVTVEYTEFQSLAPINEAFATGKVDVVFEAEPPAIIGRAAGIDIKIKGVGVSLTQEIVVHTDSSIKSMNDLKAKRIAVLSGSSSYYGVYRILERNGLSPSDVEIIDMLPADARVAFDANQVDAWAIWPPFIEQEQVSGRGRTLSDATVFIQSIIAMRGEFAKEHPEIVKDFLGVIKKSQDWISANTKESESIVAKELILPKAVVEKAWPKHNFHPKLEAKEIEDIQNKADFLYQQKLIKNKVDVSKDLVDTL